MSKRQTQALRSRKFLGALGLCVLLLGCGPDKIGPELTRRAPEGPVEQVEQAPAVAVEDTGARDAQTADVTRVALLLPLSGPAKDAGQALLGAATLALFDAYDPRIALFPYDTQGTKDGALTAARDAVSAGASIILGPLFGDHVDVVGLVAQTAGIPLLSFSNNPDVAGPGRYVLGFQVADEMKRVVDYAVGEGLASFAALAPVGLYGDRVQAEYGGAVIDAGRRFSRFDRYESGADSYDDPVKRLGDYDARRRAYRLEVSTLERLNSDIADEILESFEAIEVIGEPDFDALLIAEGGEVLRALAPLLPFYEIDPAKVRFLGTSLWADDALLGEPPLQGGWFAAPDPDTFRAFSARFESAYATAPPRIATLAYDALALVAHLLRTADAGEDPFSADRMTRLEGFSGLDGPFRFRTDGVNERMLAVLEVHRRGFRTLEPAPAAFPSFGYMVRGSEDAVEGR